MPGDLAEQLGTLARGEGNLDPSDVLALWLLRSYLLVEDLDSYEFLQPELLAELGANALYWREPLTPDAPPTLFLIRTVAGEDPLAAGPIEALHAGILKVRAAHDLRRASADEVPSELIDFASGRLAARRRTPKTASPEILGYVASDTEASNEAREALDSTADSIQLLDVDMLAPYATAIARPALVETERTFPVADGECAVIQQGNHQTLVCPVPASEIVEWPGIDDRSLFDLNVRFSLGSSRVRGSLEAAILNTDTHPNFLVQHNGLTVLCAEVETRDGAVFVSGLSVVNGAQTVVAFSENRTAVDSELRVMVKFVAVDPATDLARQIAIRSNTQNPVNARNLRALDPRQLAIKDQFDLGGTGIEYLTRPDTQLQTDDLHIRNDDAAQWLAAVYNERPWLAVKRSELFSDANYGLIFSDAIGVPQILLCRDIRRAVEGQKENIPERYVKSWRLVALVGVYLVGQLLRTSDEVQEILTHPAATPAAHDELLEILAGHAAATLAGNAAAQDNESRDDDFKVDFKSQTFLRQLGSRARSTFEEPGA